MRELLEKSGSAARAAHLLVDDAVHRAYYSMFDMARAFLVYRAGVMPDEIRRHAGLVSRFSKEAVLTGVLDPAHGRALARAFEDRHVADYTERRMDPLEARLLIDKMDAFNAAVRALFETGETS